VLALFVALVVASSHVVQAPRAAPMQFAWPAQGTITTPFVPGGHPGIDIGILRSLSVRAAAPGRVVLAGTPAGYEGYGNVVVVDVGGGYRTLYAHLSRIGVGAGDVVGTHQQLGIAGCTGWCTGTHLHFELRLRGHPVDPMSIPIG
jgi:murein DD-endopeptidase MepM/ murein hydrolase activator NlpD